MIGIVHLLYTVCRLVSTLMFGCCMEITVYLQFSGLNEKIIIKMHRTDRDPVYAGTICMMGWPLKLNK